MADYKEVAWLILTWRTTQKEREMHAQVQS